MKNLEMEFKWDANSPRAFTKMLRAVNCLADLTATSAILILDTYLDHADNRFAKEKIAFRVRNIDKQHWEATFKTRTHIIDGKAVRQEETLPLIGASSLKTALQLLADKKNWKGLSVTNLVPRFSIRNKRHIYGVKFYNCTAELSFDNCEILVRGRVVKMKEIELEFKSGDSKHFEMLAAELTQKSNLEFAKISKVKTAESLILLWTDAGK